MKGFAGGGGAGGGIYRKFRDFAVVKSPRFLTKLCPATSTTAKRSTIMKTWISAYMYK